MEINIENISVEKKPVKKKEKEKSSSIETKGSLSEYVTELLNEKLKIEKPDDGKLVIVTVATEQDKDIFLDSVRENDINVLYVSTEDYKGSNDLINFAGIKGIPTVTNDNSLLELLGSE